MNDRGGAGSGTHAAMGTCLRKFIGLPFEFAAEGSARAEEKDFDVGSSLANDASDFGDVHVLDVLEPKDLVLEVGKFLPGQIPQLFAVLGARNEEGGIVGIGKIGNVIIGSEFAGAVEIDAFAAGDREKPRGKRVAQIEPIEGLKGAEEGFLGEVRSIGGIAAGLEDETVDAFFVTGEELLESRQGAIDGLSDERLI